MENSKIVLGKEYMTRDGSKTKLVHIGTEGNYPVYGLIYRKSGTCINATWTESGINNIGDPDNLVEVKQEEPQLLEVPEKEEMKNSKIVSGKEYRTRDGRETKLIYVGTEGDYPVVGYIYDGDGGVVISEWTAEGLSIISTDPTFDLVEVKQEEPQLPEVTKKEVMKISKNNSYVTTNGLKVEISSIYENGSRYPVSGRYYKSTIGLWRDAHWRSDGGYSTVEGESHPLDLVLDNKEEIQEEPLNTGVTTLRSSWTTITFTDDLDVIGSLDLSDANIEVYTSIETVEEVTVIIGDKKYTYEEKVKKWVLVADGYGSYYDMCLAKETGHWFFYPLRGEAMGI